MPSKRTTSKRPGSPGPLTLPIGQVDDEQFMDIVEQQRAMLAQLAERMVAGDELTMLDRKIAAAALNRVAADLPSEPPRSRGGAHQAKFPHGDAALEFMILTRRPTNPLSKTAAITTLAERYSVTIEAMRKVINKHAAAAASLFE